MKKLALALASAAMVVGAQATPLSFSTSNALGPMEIAQTLTLGLFDTTLGTLNSATISFTAGISGDITLTYGAAATGAANIRGTTTSDIFITGAGALASLFSSPVSLSYTTGFQNMNPGDTYVSPTLTDSDSTGGALSAAQRTAVSAAGGGTFSFSCDSLSGFGTTGGGGFAGGSQNTFGMCNATITYDYTAPPPPTVPEPMSLALVGLALGGLSLSRKARKA